MFEYIADDIACFLIRKKIISIDERELYAYGAEVILLNITNILITFVISLLSNTILHFIVFIIVFVPLRIFSGGYHAKKSINCFIFTIISYIVTVLSVIFIPDIYNNHLMIGLLIVAVIIIILFAPVENQNNILDKKSKIRNRILSILLVSVDSIIFIILLNMQFKIATSIMSFIILSCISIILGIIRKN